MRIPETRTELRAKLAYILKRKNLSAEEYTLDFEPENFPLNIPALYPGFESYTLEIGSGWGEFTRELAHQNPQMFILSLEKKKHRIMHSVKHQKEMGLQNISWMILDIDWFFKEIFGHSQFDRIIINFPDPWPKKRHHKHRFMSSDLLDSLYNFTREGATLEFATDYWPYMEEALFLLEKSGNWKNKNGTAIILSEIPGRPKSFFEELKREAHEPVYFIQFERM